MDNNKENKNKGNKLNLLKIWNGIREIIKIRPKEANYVTSLQFNNTTIIDSKSIANLFNNHFTSIVKNVEQNIIASKSKHSDYLKNPCHQAFSTPANEQEVLKIIKLLKRNKASEPFSIPN